MSIKIEQLLPLLKKGWVAMDAVGEWYWYEIKPKKSEYCDRWLMQSAKVLWLYAFDIKPVEDWKESLKECGE